MSAQSDQRPMGDRHRRLQRALRILKEHDAKGGQGISSAALSHPQRRHPTLMLLAGKVVREERREGFQP